MTEAQVQAPTTEHIKVRVRENFRVVHEGTPYVGGDVIEVTHDPRDRNDVAGIWLKAKWVELVAASEKGRNNGNG